MTRTQVDLEIEMDTYIGNYEDVIAVSNVYYLLDKVYADIEEQTCSTCKWYNGMNECEQLDAWDCMLDEPGLWTPPDRDFGCVLWESEGDR